MIVVDASALVEVLLGTPNAGAIRMRLLANGESLHGPHLVDVQIAQVLRRYVARGDLDLARGHMALDHLTAFPLQRHSNTALLDRIWALRHNLTAYDAAYVALAEALEAPLVTCDARLAAAPGHGARIERF